MIFKGVELCCPRCRGDLFSSDAKAPALECPSCATQYPVIAGIPDLRIFPDPYIDFDADREKGKHLAAQSDGKNFEEFVAYYYSQTQVVPPAHAKLYTRGLLAAQARAAVSLQSWEQASALTGKESGQRLLEIGCGTAPLIVAAAKKYALVAGVDIAFRWLVVAKKRLDEAGIDAPLICACAERLPFPDSSFDRIASESTLEHLKDHRMALAECRRVLQPEGALFLSTPNKYSLGPDPQVGIWAGGYLPDKLIAAIVRRQGGIPPQRHLLSARELSRLVQDAGFAPPSIFLPDVSSDQRQRFGGGMRRMIDIYQTIKHNPLGRKLMVLIGPMLHAVALSEKDRSTNTVASYQPQSA